MGASVVKFKFEDEYICFRPEKSYYYAGETAKG